MINHNEYDTETPFVKELMLWLADHDLHHASRTAVLARALGQSLYEDFGAGPHLKGAFEIIGQMTLTHALGQGVQV